MPYNRSPHLQPCPVCFLKKKPKWNHSHDRSEKLSAHSPSFFRPSKGEQSSNIIAAGVFALTVHTIPQARQRSSVRSEQRELLHDPGHVVHFRSVRSVLRDFVPRWHGGEKCIAEQVLPIGQPHCVPAPAEGMNCSGRRRKSQKSLSVECCCLQAIGHESP